MKEKRNSSWLQNKCTIVGTWRKIDRILQKIIQYSRNCFKYLVVVLGGILWISLFTVLFTIKIPYYIYIHILNALPLGLEWSLDFEPLSHLKSFSHCNLWCKLLLLKHSCIVLLVDGAFLTNAFSNLLDANWGAKLYSQNKCLIQHQSVLFLLFFPSSSSCALYAYNSDINIFLLLILQTQLFLGFDIVF